MGEHDHHRRRPTLTVVGDVPIDITGSISIRKHVGRHPVPGAVGGVAAVE